MKKIFLFSFLLFAFFARSQRIVPDYNGLYCPKTNYTFTVSLPGSWNDIVVVPISYVLISGGIYNTTYNSQTNETSFNIDLQFQDVPYNQILQIRYRNRDISTTDPNYIPPPYTNYNFPFAYIKSMSTDRIVTTYSPLSIQAPRCQTGTFTVSYDRISWKNQETGATFGQITDYQVSVPAGWKVNGLTSSGINDWKNINQTSFTVESNINSGVTNSSVIIRPYNACASGLAPGTETGIPIVRPAPNMSISSPSDFTICSGSKTFTLNGLPTLGQTTWSLTNFQNTGSLGSSTNTSVTVDKAINGRGKETLQASVTDCIETYPPVTKVITFGAPTAVLIQSMNNLNTCDDESTSFRILPSSSGFYAYEGTLTVIGDYDLATNFTWDQIAGSNSNFAWSANGRTVTVSSKTGGMQMLTLKCTISNSCGSATKYFYFGPECAIAARIAKPSNESTDIAATNVLQPNPTKGIINLHIDTGIKSVVVLNMSGIEIERIKFRGGNQTETINIQNLPVGVYIIRIFDGKQWISRKVSKQ